MSIANDNGSGAPHVAPQTVAVLKLTLSLETFALTIDGAVPCLDVAMAMLDQAKREFKNRLRAEAAQKVLAGARPALPGELDALLRRNRG